MIYDLQKASMWKRISAFLFDGIVLSVCAVLFAWALSGALGFDKHNEALDAAYAHYGEAYGVDFSLSLSAYDAMTQEERGALNDAYAALSADPQAVAAYNAVIHLTLTIISLGALLGFALLEFAVPLRLGNGQTLGKKIFGVGLMLQNGVCVSTKAMFIRTFLGKYTFETMVPILLIMMIWFDILGLTGIIVLIGLLIVQALMLMLTQERLTIHDAMAATIAVDLASQMIFPDEAAMIAYIEKVHQEKAAKETY